MPTTVTFYDDFVGVDITTMNNDELKVALVASSYTFDSSHAAFSTDIQPDETVGSGYSELDYVQFARSGGAAGVTDYELSGSPAFGAMTTTDYQYAVVYDSNTDQPILCIDTGTVNALTVQGLIISGTVFTTTF